MIETRSLGEVIILALPALLDAEALQLAIQEQVEAGHRQVVLNLEAVTFIESSGLGALVAAFKYCEAHGGKLGFYGIQPQVRQLLDLTKLSRVLKVFHSESEALAGIAG